MGHSAGDVWSYSPREIVGYLDLAGERLKRESAEQLALHATAAQGDPKKLEKRLKEMQREFE